MILQPSIPMPQCPYCDAADTLKAERVEGNGVFVCVCTCCAKQCRVNADGVVIHSDKRDLGGIVMTDP